MSRNNGNGSGLPPEEDPNSIGNVLMELNLCTREQLRTAVRLQKRKLGEIFVDMGVISEKDLEWVLRYQKMLEEDVDPKKVRLYIREKKLQLFSDMRSTNAQLLLLADKLNKA